jgi:hypothetical protein
MHRDIYGRCERVLVLLMGRSYFFRRFVGITIALGDVLDLTGVVLETDHLRVGLVELWG